MKTVVRMLVRMGVPQETMIAFLYRYFNFLGAIKAELNTLGWYVLIAAFGTIHSAGLHAAAEWFARVTGLRARLEEIFKEPPQVTG